MEGQASLLFSVCTVHRSGDLAGEYEQKKADMQKTQEETNFSYHKKKVSPHPLDGGTFISSIQHKLVKTYLDSAKRTSVSPVPH